MCIHLFLCNYIEFDLIIKMQSEQGHVFFFLHLVILGICLVQILLIFSLSLIVCLVYMYSCYIVYSFNSIISSR